VTTQQCRTCRADKPLSDFSANETSATGYSHQCKDCKAAETRARRKNIPAEDKAESMRAYRAGIRKDKCAVCGSTISGHGICDQCADAVATLGGLAGLKQAVRAVRYLVE